MEKVLVILFTSLDSKTYKTIHLFLRFRIDKSELGFLINGVLVQIFKDWIRKK